MIQGVDRNTKVNPFQTSIFTCYVEGFPFPSDTAVSFHFVSGDTYNASGIDMENSLTTMTSESTLTAVFLVERVIPGYYICSLYNDFTAGVLVQSNTFGLYS